MVQVPSLVTLCQRAAISNADAIQSLGHLSYHLVKPILAASNPDQLSRFESSSPHLQIYTSEIWRDLCFQKYHLTASERFSPDDNPDPDSDDSWRSRYFDLHNLEAKRIDEIGAKVRTQRLEAEEKKKEKEIKTTVHIPPAKRPRTTGWNSVSQPKSLFQKTRSEASKIQRALNARILPPAPRGNLTNHRLSPHVASDSSLPPVSPSPRNVHATSSVPHRPSSVPILLPSNPTSVSPSLTTSEIDVKTPSSSTASSTSTVPSSSSAAAAANAAVNATAATPLPPTEIVFATPPTPPGGTQTTSEISRSPPKMRNPAKRDPMASLFLPKRKPPQRQT